MTADPRPALSKLIAAFERHLEASVQRRDEDDPTVIAAYEDLADAFEAYDDTLHDATGEMTPLIVVDDQLADELGVDDREPETRGGGVAAGGADDADADDDADDYDEDEDDQTYAGLDDEDYETDDESPSARP